MPKHPLSAHHPRVINGNKIALPRLNALAAGLVQDLETDNCPILVLKFIKRPQNSRVLEEMTTHINFLKLI